MDENKQTLEFPDDWVLNYLHEEPTPEAIKIVRDSIEKFLIESEEITLPYTNHLCKCIIGQYFDELPDWKIKICDWLFYCFTYKIQTLDGSMLIDSQLIEDVLLYLLLDSADRFDVDCFFSYSTLVLMLDDEKIDELYGCYRNNDQGILNHPTQFNYSKIMEYYKGFVASLVDYRNNGYEAGEFTVVGISKLLNDFLENCWAIKEKVYSFTLPEDRTIN